MQAAELGTWTPVRLIVAPPAPVIDWSPLRPFRFTEPFFAQTIQRVLTDAPKHPLIRTTLSDMAAIEMAVPGRDPDALVFHTSRCGSTLVSRLIATLADFAVISEPDCLNALLELDRATIHEDVLVECVRLLIRALCRGRIEPRVVVKLSSWNLRSASILAQAFPDSRTVLIYRQPEEIVASLVNEPPGWMRLGREHLEEAKRLMGITAEGSLSSTEMAMAAVQALFNSALDADDLFPMHLVDHNELPAAIWKRILPFLGHVPDTADVEGLRLASAWHAKSPGQVFSPDSARKLAMLRDDTRRNVAKHIVPLYMSLDQRRIERLGG